MKPVAAGQVRAGGAWVSEDALALRAASTVQVPAELDNPVLLPDPLSPHIAAERAGVRIDIAELHAATTRSRSARTPWWWKARAAFTCRCPTPRPAPISRRPWPFPSCWSSACGWVA